MGEPSIRESYGALTDLPRIGRDDVVQAGSRLNGRVRTTPLLDVECNGVQVHLKLETMQHTGSFKVRGALNRLLASNRIPEAGCVAASGGNHGIAVAYAAQTLGVPATVFLPTTAPKVKAQRIASLGATVMIDTDYPSAVMHARAHATKTGAIEIHAYDDPFVIAGQGTLALEISLQCPAVGSVLVAVGGGGLAAGIRAWFDDRTDVVAVEPAGAPTLFQAIAHNRPVNVGVDSIAADSLGAHRLGDHAFRILGGRTSVVQLSDEEIIQGQRWLWDQVRVVAEPGGATALAAILSGWRPTNDGPVVVVVCGANTDLNTFPG